MATTKRTTEQTSPEPDVIPGGTDEPSTAPAPEPAPVDPPPADAEPTTARGPEPGTPAPTPPADEPAPRQRRRRSDAGRPRGTNKAGRPTNKSVRTARVEALYRQLGDALAFTVLVSPRLGAVGAAMSQNAETFGATWAEWAETSTRVAAAIDNISFGGAGLAVLLAHLPLVDAVRSAPAEAVGIDLGALLGMIGLSDDATPPTE